MRLVVDRSNDGNQCQKTGRTHTDGEQLSKQTIIIEDQDGRPFNLIAPLQTDQRTQTKEGKKDV